MKVLASLTLAFLATLATGAELQRDHTDPAGKCKYRHWPFFSRYLREDYNININKCGKIIWAFFVLSLAGQLGKYKNAGK